MCFEMEVEDRPQSEALPVDCDRLALMLHVMNSLGMIEHGDPPDIPVPEGHGTTTARVEAVMASGAADIPPDVLPFADALGQYYSSQADKPSGIPCYKLSHEGWLITPGEIISALGWWATSSPETQECVGRLAWWPEWITLLKTARDHGGIRIW